MNFGVDRVSNVLVGNNARARPYLESIYVLGHYDLFAALTRGIDRWGAEVVSLPAPLSIQRITEADSRHVLEWAAPCAQGPRPRDPTDH